MRNVFLLTLSLATLLVPPAAQGLDILFDKNGYAPINGGQITGTSISAQPIGNTSSSTVITGLVASGNYNVDFFHNSGSTGSDFSFKVNAAGTGIELVNPSGGGYNMVTGFTTGTDTLTLNTGTITYNANQGQTGRIFIPGLIPNNTGDNSPPQVVTAIPGKYNVDNVYNSGAGNEDYGFLVSDTFQTSVAPGDGGGGTGVIKIPNSEYATFSGSDVNVRSETVHYILTSDNSPNVISTHPRTNDTGWVNIGGEFVREFDVLMPIGGSGLNISSFGNHTVTFSDADKPDGSPFQGTISTNDFLFRPTLRYDGVSNGTGFYWFGPGPGTQNTVTGIAEGFFDGNVNPLSVTVTALLPAYVDPPVPIPEPSSFALLGLGVAGIVFRRRRNS